ncbi:MAG: carboxypeptidase regulatory-like domain-containing protein [Gemmatimonadota bacterium]
MRTLILKSVALFPAVVLFGCGGGGEGAGSSSGGQAGEATEAAAPAVSPEEAAAIRGTISFDGTPPPAEPIDMSEEPACAAKYGDQGPTTQTVVVNEGKLANVFVYVKEGLSGSFPPPEESVEIDQAGCRYHPHVLGVQTGQTLLIKNDDPVLHNINTQPTANRGFNISQPQAGMESRRQFRTPEVMIPVKCDVHGWMHAYIGVVDHPYFAVSGADGSFEIPNLPPGDYVIEAWHEKYGTLTQNVTLGPQETQEVAFQYSADMAAGADVPLGTPLVVDHGSAAAGRRSPDPQPAGAGR